MLGAVRAVRALQDNDSAGGTVNGSATYHTCDVTVVHDGCRNLDEFSCVRRQDLVRRRRRHGRVRADRPAGRHLVHRTMAWRFASPAISRCCGRVGHGFPPPDYAHARSDGRTPHTAGRETLMYENNRLRRNSIAASERRWLAAPRRSSGQCSSCQDRRHQLNQTLSFSQQRLPITTRDDRDLRRIDERHDEYFAGSRLPLPVRALTGDTGPAAARNRGIRPRARPHRLRRRRHRPAPGLDRLPPVGARDARQRPNLIGPMLTRLDMS